MSSRNMYVLHFFLFVIVVLVLLLVVSNYFSSQSVISLISAVKQNAPTQKLLKTLPVFQLIGSVQWRFGLVGNIIGHVNEVKQRQARLVLGWVTICRRVNHVGM